MKQTSGMNRLGFAAILGAVAASIYELAWGMTGASFIEAPDTWVQIYTLGILSAFLLLLGVTAIYAYHANQNGLFGVVAYAFAVLGLLAFFGWSWGGVVVIPATIAYDPGFVTSPSEVWQFANAFLISHLLWAAGLLVFGVMVWRAGQLPRMAAGLLILGSLIGAIDAYANLGPLDPPFGPVIIGSIGLAWMGLRVWRGDTAKSQSKGPAKMIAGLLPVNATATKAILRNKGVLLSARD